MLKYQQVTRSCGASDGSLKIGGYRVFLVAIEGFVYQVVEITRWCVQIISGKCDQKLEQTIISVFGNIISIFIQG